MSLSQLKPGKKAVIVGLDSSGSLRPFVQRLMEMGLTLGTEVELAHEAPFGGAIAVRCRGALIALRKVDAGCIEIKEISK